MGAGWSRAGRGQGGPGQALGIDGVGDELIVVLLVRAVIGGVGKDGDVHARALDGEGLHIAIQGGTVLIEAAAGKEGVLIGSLDEHLARPRVRR